MLDARSPRPTSPRPSTAPSIFSSDGNKVTRNSNNGSDRNSADISAKRCRSALTGLGRYCVCHLGAGDESGASSDLATSAAAGAVKEEWGEVRTQKAVLRGPSEAAGLGGRQAAAGRSTPNVG